MAEHDTAVTDDDNPEWTESDFARAKPLKEVFPEALASLRSRGGRPKVERPKVHIGFRLSADLVEGIKAGGKGYNARVEKGLRDALAEGKL